MRVIRQHEKPLVAASHEDPNNPGVLKRVLLTLDELTAGRVQMINWAKLPVGSTFQLHYHEDMQEVFVLMQGDVEMRVDQHLVKLKPGDTIVVDANERHQMRNLGKCDAEYLVVGISGLKKGKTVVVNA